MIDACPGSTATDAGQVYIIYTAQTRINLFVAALLAGAYMPQYFIYAQMKYIKQRKYICRGAGQGIRPTNNMGWPGMTATNAGIYNAWAQPRRNSIIVPAGACLNITMITS